MDDLKKLLLSSEIFDKNQAKEDDDKENDDDEL